MQGSLSSLFLGTKWSWIRGDCDTDNSSQRSHLVANSLLDHRWLTKCWGYPVCGFSPLDVTWLPGAPQQRPSSCAHQNSWCHEVLPHISLATQGFLARAGKGYLLQLAQDQAWRFSGMRNTVLQTADFHMYLHSPHSWHSSRPPWAANWIFVN